MNIVLQVLILSSIVFNDTQVETNFFKSFDGVQIAYTDVGAGDPVMLIHGFISNGSSWNKTVLNKVLLDSGYRVIIPDLRGNGNSDKPHDPRSYQNDAEIKDLAALANHLGLKYYSAIGYSRGAIVLAKLLTQESRISKAVLGGMGIDFTNPYWDRRIMFAKAFGGEIPLTDETRGAVEYATSIGADLEILSLLQQFQPVTSVKQLGKIKTNVLVIAGNQDTDNGDPWILAESMKHGAMVIVPGDHNNTYKGDVFANAIISFLAE